MCGTEGLFALPPAAQRSAQELPLVEKQSVDSSPATGGKTMVLSGHNFLPDSKVVFVEKAQGKPSCSAASKLPPYLAARSTLRAIVCLSFSLSLSSLSLSRFLSPSFSPHRQNIPGPASKPHVVCIKALYF